MSQTQIDLTEFIINNQEVISYEVSVKLLPFCVASRIFDNHPDIQESFLNKNKLSILRHYLLEHFQQLNFEDMSLLCDEEMLKLIK